ncbi:MAG: ATP-binding protein, partial [Ferrovibrio sp.]
PEMTDPVEIMEASLRTFRERAEGRGVFMSMAVDARLFEGFVDRQALRQILLNLISNAVKFTPPGGRIEVGAEPLDDGAFGIWVRDTGIGIAPENIPVVLAPFGQVENDLTRQYEGTGLGLPLVKSLVEMHGGRFEIHSALGDGTLIRAEFPPPPSRTALSDVTAATPAAASD